jgi:hypothetical protein
MKKVMVILLSLVFVFCGACCEKKVETKEDKPMAAATESEAAALNAADQVFEVKGCFGCKGCEGLEKKILCGIGVGGAISACVVTEGEACLEALAVVAAAGCCPCLPGVLETMCEKATVKDKKPKAKKAKAKAKPKPKAAPKKEEAKKEEPKKVEVKKVEPKKEEKKNE